MNKIMIVLGLVTLTACGPSYVEPHQIGTVKCYQVKGGNQIGSWENATLHYSNSDGRDSVRVYLTSRENDNGLTRIRVSDNVIARYYVHEGVCTITPYKE
jgi:hypothetical protein